MKLNYRDKVILGIVLAIAILLAGYFMLIKPKNEDIKSNKATLEDLEKTEREYKQKISQIEPLKEGIGNIVKETKEVTKHFVPIEDVNNPVKLDRFMQHFAVENNIRVLDLAVGDMSESTIGYYYIERGSDVGSGLREFADINGKYQADIDAAKAEGAQLSEREPGNVLQTQYGITAKGKKEDLWKLMDAIEKQDKTIIINSVEFSAVNSEEDATKEEQPATDAEGNPVQIPTFSEGEETEYRPILPEDEVEMKLVISIYSVYELPQPNLENLE